jgi:hypothetical protein
MLKDNMSSLDTTTGLILKENSTRGTELLENTQGYLRIIKVSKKKSNKRFDVTYSAKKGTSNEKGPYISITGKKFKDVDMYVHCEDQDAVYTTESPVIDENDENIEFTGHAWVAGWGTSIFKTDRAYPGKYPDQGGIFPTGVMKIEFRNRSENDFEVVCRGTLFGPSLYIGKPPSTQEFVIRVMTSPFSSKDYVINHVGIDESLPFEKTISIGRLSADGEVHVQLRTTDHKTMNDSPMNLIFNHAKTNLWIVQHAI